MKNTILRCYGRSCSKALYVDFNKNCYECTLDKVIIYPFLFIH